MEWTVRGKCDFLAGRFVPFEEGQTKVTLVAKCAHSTAALWNGRSLVASPSAWEAWWIKRDMQNFWSVGKVWGQLILKKEDTLPPLGGIGRKRKFVPCSAETGTDLFSPHHQRQVFPSSAFFCEGENMVSVKNLPSGVVWGCSAPPVAL